MIFPYSDEARRPPLWASRQFSSKVSGMMESSSRIIGVDATVGDFIFLQIRERAGTTKDKSNEPDVTCNC